MQAVFDYNHRYARQYLKDFRAYFNNPSLTVSQLNAILKTFWERKGWRYFDDGKGGLLYFRNDIEQVLGQRSYYLPQFQQGVFGQWQKNKIKKDWEKEPPIDYSSPEEDMDYVSQKMIDETIDKTVSSGSYIFCKNENGEWCILAGKRGSTAPSEPNKYNIPVGMKDTPQEDSVECAARECYEETGLRLSINLFKHVGYDEWAPGQVGNNFLVTLPNTTENYTIGNGDGENDKFIWIPMSQINKFQWAYGMNRIIVDIYNKHMKKNIYITESQLKYILKAEKDAINENGVMKVKYAVEPNKVKVVKKFLDDNFTKAGLAHIGEDGYPATLPFVVMNGTDGIPARKMYDKQLFELLLDKYGKLYAEMDRTKRFLQQIMKDWYYDKISKEGLLSVNQY